MQPLRATGVATINGQQLPVFESDDVSGRFVAQGDLLLTVEGAKTFKRGQYPLHPSIRETVTAAITGTVPFALRNKTAQMEGAQTVLQAMMARLIAMNLPQVAA